MILKTFLTAGSVLALLAGPALAQTAPTRGETQREQSRDGRAAQTNPNNEQGARTPTRTPASAPQPPRRRRAARTAPSARAPRSSTAPAMSSA